MKRFAILLSLIYAMSTAGQTPEEISILMTSIIFFLEEVVFGLVDYEKLRQNPERLNQLVGQIATYSTEGRSQDHQTAFYINAYNILVIKQITDQYPVNSPMDIKGFFKVKTFVVAGETLTLDGIEFTKLIGPTKDPRIHFALGCGARSCPFLYDNAYYPDKLQEQLEFRAELIIDRPNYVLVDEKNEKVVLNKIFDWYSDQFISNAGSLINYVNTYRFYKVPEQYTVEFQEYDWTLNDR